MSLFVCWLWKGHGWDAAHEPATYGKRHVERLASMLHRHGGHDLVCVTDDGHLAQIVPGISVITMPQAVSNLPRYYPKLWAFSAECGRMIGARFTSIDLDTIITGDVGQLTQREVDFIVWDQAKGEPYNTSFFTLEPGARVKVWEQFSAQKECEARQAWIAAGHRWTGDQSWVGWVLGPHERTYSDRDGLIRYRASLHRQKPVAGGLAYFLCGPYDPAVEAEHSAWVRDAWQ